ncbi:WD40 repeat-like protein, partial [Athelia psychrophila]
MCTKKGFESRETEKLTVVFLRAHLLHWFEAMSLLKKSEEIAPMLQRVATWLENTFEDKSLKDLVIKAINFARKFAAEIAEHPLYVYYTALPLLPSHSMLYQTFHNLLADPSVLLVSHLDKEITSMAFSTDGRRLVTGFYNTYAVVWDAATGEELLRMADTNTPDFTRSVAFLCDGSRIACGTDEATIYVWDSMTGARVIGPLNHSGSSRVVNVVAWSTDGECLLSGCE